MQEKKASRQKKTKTKTAKPAAKQAYAGIEIAPVKFFYLRTYATSALNEHSLTKRNVSLVPLREDISESGPQIKRITSGAKTKSI